MWRTDAASDNNSGRSLLRKDPQTYGIIRKEKDEARSSYWQVASISRADTDPGDVVDAPLDHTTEAEEGPGLAELYSAALHLV